MDIMLKGIVIKTNFEHIAMFLQIMCLAIRKRQIGYSENDKTIKKLSTDWKK